VVAPVHRIDFAHVRGYIRQCALLFLHSRDDDDDDEKQNRPRVRESIGLEATREEER
jgi:hypothetical protein